MASIRAHVAAIHEIFEAADRHGILFWLGNGWAVDAMLGHMTREHEDIDLVYDVAEQERVQALLESLSFVVSEWTDYGFILERGEVELDMDRCIRTDDGYTFEGYPLGCCPLEPNGLVEGLAVRCTTWDALYLEMLYNRQEIPAAAWREKDHESFRVIAAHLPASRKAELEVLATKTFAGAADSVPPDESKGQGRGT
jgi:2''-aminoglycoside nucleotidyltransferase